MFQSSTQLRLPVGRETIVRAGAWRGAFIGFVAARRDDRIPRRARTLDGARPPGARPGFTMAELLITLAVIILLVTLAVPAFNAITGNRSIDAAQNQLSAIIARARQEALGMQDSRGVLLFQDPNTGRYAAAMVWFPDPGGSPNVLDLDPNRDEVLLPVGIGAQVVENTGGYSGGGVLMFNGQGQFTSLPYLIKNGSIIAGSTNALTGGPYIAGSNLMSRITVANGSAYTGSTNDSTQFGFVLFPSAGYQTQLEKQGNGGVNATEWISDNGVGFMVNRYNGTLLRTE